MYHYPFMCQGIELPKAAPSSNKAIFSSKNSDLSIKLQFPAKQPCTHPEPTTLLWAQKSQIKQSRRASHLLFFWFHPNCSSKPHSGSWVWSGKTKDSDKITSKETAPDAPQLKRNQTKDFLHILVPATRFSAVYLWGFILTIFYSCSLPLPPFPKNRYWNKEIILQSYSPAQNSIYGTNTTTQGLISCTCLPNS